MAFKKKSSGWVAFFVIIFIIGILVGGGYYLRSLTIKNAEKVISDCEKIGGESFCSDNLGLKYCVCNKKQEKTVPASDDGLSNVLKIEEELV